MFCPQCGTKESDELKFCKSCGANLVAVREAATRRDTGDKHDWRTDWLSEVSRFKKTAHEERERRLNRTPEEKRILEIKAGVITASVGLAVGVFLFVFMQGIILGGRVNPTAVEILARLWVVGVIPLCVGLGLLINGLFVKSPRKPATTAALEEEDQRESLRAPDTSRSIPSSVSVTEETTRHLRDSDREEMSFRPRGEQKE